jgi:hypothetical protein
MIEKEIHVSETYNLKHRNDSNTHVHFDYENNLVKKMLPKYIYSNDKMYDYLMYLQRIWVLTIEMVLPIKNFYNYTVEKYWNKHNS